jgi:hypothetical protein
MEPLFTSYCSARLVIEKQTNFVLFRFFFPPPRLDGGGRLGPSGREERERVKRYRNKKSRLAASSTSHTSPEPPRDGAAEREEKVRKITLDDRWRSRRQEDTRRGKNVSDATRRATPIHHTPCAFLSSTEFLLVFFLIYLLVIFELLCWAYEEARGGGFGGFDDAIGWRIRLFVDESTERVSVGE